MTDRTTSIFIKLYGPQPLKIYMRRPATWGAAIGLFAFGLVFCFASFVKRDASKVWLSRSS